MMDSREYVEAGLNDLGYYGHRNPLEYAQQDAPKIRWNGRILRAMAHMDRYAQDGFDEPVEALTNYDR